MIDQEIGLTLVSIAELKAADFVRPTIAHTDVVLLRICIQRVRLSEPESLISACSRPECYQRGAPDTVRQPLLRLVTLMNYIILFAFFLGICGEFPREFDHGYDPNLDSSQVFDVPFQKGWNL